MSEAKGCYTSWNDARGAAECECCRTNSREGVLMKKRESGRKRCF